MPRWWKRYFHRFFSDIPIFSEGDALLPHQQPRRRLLPMQHLPSSFSLNWHRQQKLHNPISEPLFLIPTLRVISTQGHLREHLSGQK
jgi:hypothetical protein